MKGQGFSNIPTLQQYYHFRYASEVTHDTRYAS